MNHQVKEKALYLVFMYRFQGVWKPQNCMQKLKCTSTFLRKGTWAFPRVPQKLNLPIVSRALHKEKGDPGFYSIPSSATNCYVSLEVILYLWVSVSQFVNEENETNQNLQILSLQSREIFWDSECHPTQHMGYFFN